MLSAPMAQRSVPITAAVCVHRYQVSVTVNSEPVDLKMMLGPLGEAFFISELEEVRYCMPEWLRT